MFNGDLCRVSYYLTVCSEVDLPFKAAHLDIRNDEGEQEAEGRKLHHHDAHRQLTVCLTGGAFYKIILRIFSSILKGITQFTAP